MSTTPKQTLRKSVKSRLSALSQEDIGRQSTLAQSQILRLPQYRSARAVSIYLSMPAAEAQTDALIRDALTSGKRVFVPYISRHEGRRSVVEMLRLRDVEEYEGLERDGWGIPSLGAEGLERRENARGGVGVNGAGGEGEGLDLVVVPGVAFDAGMHRLGHGKGFYDEFLTRYCAGGQRRKPFLVGLCLAEQYLEQDSIPTSDHDWRMDAVAVGDGRLEASKAS